MELSNDRNRIAGCHMADVPKTHDGTHSPLRVIVASKFWYLRGGLERVMFDEIDGLQSAGHVVAGFSTTHPENEASKWSGYFAPHIELGTESSISQTEKVRAAARMFWNRPAQLAFDRLLADFRPDVVHIHGIHRQLSPSILIADENAEVYRLSRRFTTIITCVPRMCSCAPAPFRAIPPRCGPINTIPCVVNRCVRGSLGTSALSAAETSFQRARGAYRAYGHTVHHAQSLP